MIHLSLFAKAFLCGEKRGSLFLVVMSQVPCFQATLLAGEIRSQVKEDADIPTGAGETPEPPPDYRSLPTLSPPSPASEVDSEATIEGTSSQKPPSQTTVGVEKSGPAAGEGPPAKRTKLLPPIIFEREGWVQQRTVSDLWTMQADGIPVSRWAWLGEEPPRSRDLLEVLDLRGKYF